MRPLLSSIILREGITHIEDLPLKDFIHTVESLKDKVVTEKLDGANLWFGIDDNGFFTSREGKSSKTSRFYSVKDYAMVSNYNAFRAAHLALEKVQSTIKKHLAVGDTVEIEVLFGRQPNSVTYGNSDKNYIVILGGAGETPDDKVRSLADALNRKNVEVVSTIIYSLDGKKLESSDDTLTWEFTKVKPISGEAINTKEATVLLGELKKFIAEKNGVLKDKTNGDVIDLNLTSVPKEQREEAKAERERLKQFILDKFKNPIKELLLDRFVRKIKPFLQAKDLKPSEDIGVEGVVVKDPVTGQQTKIVDKDVFTAVNSFNSGIRANIAGLVRTADQDAPIESRGGVFGQAKIRIAELLGAKELAVSSSMKRFISKFKGDTAQDTAAAVANSLNISSLPSTKVKASAILSNAISEIDAILDGFKKDAGEYKLTLKTGKEIGITPEVMKKTLTAFAETRRDIEEIKKNVAKSNTVAELVLALYGRTIDSLFNGGNSEVKESFTLLKSINEDGEGGEGGATTAAATTAGDIAPAQKLLFTGSKMISRRPRNFQKTKKFPMPTVNQESEKFKLIKSVNENTEQSDSMEYAKDVDDNAVAKNDVEFNQLRNSVNVGNDVTTMDVNRYLDKAHELNDEVDTVTFGMETDDGAVVKVYVNAMQAEDFEKALASMLGQEDDIEEVINALANTFDIVDVEWPEGLVKNADETTAQTPDTEEPAAPAELPDTVAPPVEPAEEPAEEPADTSDEEEPEIDLSTETDPNAKEESDEESDEEEVDELGNPVKKKKKEQDDTKTEESFTASSSFLKSVLSEAELLEAKKKKKSHASKKLDVATEKKVESLLDSFPQKHQRAIIDLIVHLGMPVRYLLINKADLRDSIVPASQQYLKSITFRTWTKKLTDVLKADGVHEDIEDDESSEQINEVVSAASFSNRYQRIIYNIMTALGNPKAAEVSANKALIAGIRAKAKLFTQDSSARVALNTVAKLLGINTDDPKSDVPSVPESNTVNDEVLAEDVAAATSTVTSLITALGFDVDANRSIQAQLARPQVKRALMKLSSNRMVQKRLQDAASSIGHSAGTAMSQFADVQKSGPVIGEESDK